MTSILVRLDHSYEAFVEPNGSCVAKLDKALYGTVEAAKLWYDLLSGQLREAGFTQNPYDLCVFNKIGSNGNQITVALHVDDMLITCKDQCELDRFRDHILDLYKDSSVHTGDILDYVGMTFDFAARPGSVEVTMKQITSEILEGGGVTTAKATPATATLFDVRESSPKLTRADHDFFKSYVPKILYVAKRVRPEVLTAIAFLTTRVQCSDQDDLGKLKRVIGYLYGCPDRGICLTIGDDGVKVVSHIDAAYGVHTESGKSHTGCTVSLGLGPIYVKSAKQKIVTKSSTEAELVGLSDTASQAMYIRNFIEAQGYTTGPVTMYQDNMSCLALVKRGGPCSERSRHISIRRFWMKERVDGSELVMEHKPTEDMFVNALTKPVQGRQFLKERQGLTNWDR